MSHALALAPTPSDTSAFVAVQDLCPEALFDYFDAVAKGTPRAEALRAAQIKDRVMARAAKPAVRHFDVVWGLDPMARVRARELVATWFERNDAGGRAGHFFTHDFCVCVEVREADARDFAADLRRLERAAGYACDAIARIDPQGAVSVAAFGARRKPTVILRQSA